LNKRFGRPKKGRKLRWGEEGGEEEKGGKEKVVPAADNAIGRFFLYTPLFSPFSYPFQSAMEVREKEGRSFF